MLPVGFFTGQEKRVFEHANRVHPIYFEYPYEKVEESPWNCLKAGR